MTKKRLFVLIAVVVIMALSVCSLVACNKPAGDVDSNGGNLVENQKPSTGGTINDDDYDPSEGLEYKLADDGTGYILTGIGTCKDDELIIPSVYSPNEDGTGELPVVAIGDNALAEKDDSIRKKEVEVKGSNLLTIGIGAFRGCNALTEITLPDTVKTIGKAAFKGCEVLTTFSFPQDLVTVGDGAFYGCIKLAEITLPNKLENISSQMFGACTGLKSVLLSTETKTIAAEAFRGCTSLIIVTLPSEKPEGIEEKEVKNVFPTTLTEIGKGAFMECSKLAKAMTLPSGVAKVSDQTFYGCGALKEINIGASVKEIGTQAFYDCKALSKVKLPEGLIEIKDQAFEGTKALEEITFNFRLTTIGKRAFHKSGLKKVDLTPSSVEYIGKLAFAECDKLANVSFPATLKVIDEGAFMRSGVLPLDENDEPTADTGRAIEFLYKGSSSDWNTKVKKYALTDPSAEHNFWGDIDSKFVIKCSDKDVDLVFDSVIQA